MKKTTRIPEKMSASMEPDAVRRESAKLRVTREAVRTVRVRTAVRTGGQSEPNCSTDTLTGTR